VGDAKIAGAGFENCLFLKRRCNKRIVISIKGEENSIGIARAREGKSFSSQKKSGINGAKYRRRRTVVQPSA